jgi:hypothetical protein
MTSASTPRSCEVPADDPGVAGGDPLAAEVVGAGRGAGHGGVVEGGACEPEPEDLLGVAVAVEEQVPAGDADLELAGADVGGDVTRPQEEELGVVLVVDEHQLVSRAALAVARLAEHRDGGLGQRPLVRHGDAQHGGPQECRNGA